MDTANLVDEPAAPSRRAAAGTYDIYFVGVGGQGVLTIGEIITEAAFCQGIPVNFFPTKGMAQRGGFVKAQLRMGRTVVGPAIPERGADLVIAAEVSEALRAVRYVKPGGDFLLYGYVWAPTAVMLGKAPYPALGQVVEAARAAIGPEGRLLYIDPGQLPAYDGAAVPDNVYTLAVALRSTRLGQLLPAQAVAEVLQARWKRGVERNLFAFEAGLAAELAEIGPAL